ESLESYIKPIRCYKVLLSHINHFFTSDLYPHWLWLPESTRFNFYHKKHFQFPFPEFQLRFEQRTNLLDFLALRANFYRFLNYNNSQISIFLLEVTLIIIIDMNVVIVVKIFFVKFLLHMNVDVHKQNLIQTIIIFVTIIVLFHFMQTLSSSS